MNIRAVLKTHRDIKGVQYFGSDMAAMSTLADSWLDAHGQPGDSFEILRVDETVVMTQPYKGHASVIVESTPVPGPVLQHAFVPGSGVHCDKCGGIHA